MKCFSIDIETTGLDPKRHSIIEFGAIMFDLFDRNAPKKSFVRYVNPEDMVWSQFCLNMHHIWLRTVNYRIKYNQLEAITDDSGGYWTQEPKICQNFAEVEIDFIQWLTEQCGFQAPDATGKWPEKITPAGKNFASFDLQFLLAAGMPARLFHHRALDPSMLYLHVGDKVPPDLKTCKERCPTFKGNTEVAHNTLDDASDVITLLHEFLASKSLRSVIEAARGGPAPPLPRQGFA